MIRFYLANIKNFLPKFDTPHLKYIKLPKKLCRTFYAANPMRNTIATNTQKRHPKLVEQPLPRNSKTRPKIFSPQPRKLNSKRAIITMTMIATTSISLTF